jgi:hypothetical protein
VSDLTELKDQLDQLSLSLDRANSYWRALLRGLFYGFGSAFGAAVVFAAIISLLTITIQTVYDIPVLGSLIENTPLLRNFIEQQR